MAREYLYSSMAPSGLSCSSISFSRTIATADAMPPKTTPDSSKTVLKRPASHFAKSSSPYANETITALLPVGAEQELIDADLILPSVLPFKRMQMSEKYPKGHARGRHWKHLKQILQAENYHLYPADEPTYVNIESPPSMYPAKKYCDISGFEAPYTDPRTKLRYASADIYKHIRSLSDEYIQGYLALRNAAITLK